MSGVCQKRKVNDQDHAMSAALLIAIHVSQPHEHSCDAAARNPPSFDASRMREGRFTYDLTEDGSAAGQFVLTIRRQPNGTWKLTGDAIGFEQHWDAVTTAQFKPLRATLIMRRQDQPYRMELRYNAEHVTAIEITSNGAATQSHKSRTEKSPAATVDQRIDWASMLASDLVPGQTAGFYVFDALTGSSPLCASASRAPRMSSPLGDQNVIRFDYRVNKRGETEAYTVYATDAIPRVMLREDLRGHEVAILSRVEP
jgi:hypothetical protein